MGVEKQMEPSLTFLHQIDYIMSQIDSVPEQICTGLLSLVRSSETSKNDSQTSRIPAGLVRRTTAYLWFSHKLHWLYIFQTREWCIRTSDFYNPLARRTCAFSLKFRSLLCSSQMVVVSVKQSIFPRCFNSTIMCSAWGGDLNWNIQNCMPMFVSHSWVLW